MKITKVGMRLLLALAMIGLCANNAFSAEAWYTCTITKIGGDTGDSGSIYVRLNDTRSTFSNVYFRIPAGRLNQILAVLLTAASNGATVYVKADPVARTLSNVYYNVE